MNDPIKLTPEGVEFLKKCRDNEWGAESQSPYNHSLNSLIEGKHSSETEESTTTAEGGSIKNED